MKLAFLSLLDIAPWGGSEALWFATAKLALQQKHRVFTATCYWPQAPGTITELSGLGAVTHFRKGYQPALGARLWKRLKGIVLKESSEVRALKKFDPDMILVNQAGSYDILHNANLVAYLLFTGKPYFIICHNYDEDVVVAEEARPVLIQLFRRAKAVFVICQRQIAVLQKQLAFSLLNIQIIHNPVNLEEIRCLVLPSFPTIHMASVASLHVDRKGQDMVLEVLSSQKWKGRNWHFNIYGTGPHQKYLEHLVHYFGLGEQVTFKGHVSDITALWQENHLLLVSSRIESGPMVMMEAMLCGRPVVATCVGKVPEVVQDGYNGYMAAAATVPLFDEALERAWESRLQWSEVGKRAHEAALARIDLHAPATFLELLLKAK